MRTRSVAISDTESFNASPIPTMPATFSVPARRLLSCAPPWNSGKIGVPFFTYRARLYPLARRIYARKGTAYRYRE
jgi:hypothetical protein